PLQTSEIWAIPIFLRFSMLQNLSETLRVIIKPETDPVLPKIDQLLPSLINAQENASTSDQRTVLGNRVANIIHSMRSVLELDWNDFFEKVSVLEKLLQEDPAGIYADMDFKTRDLYRKKIEKLARKSNHTEIELANCLLKHSRQFSLKETSSKDSDSTKNIHIGEFLIGKHCRYFEKEISYHPGFKATINNWILRHGKGVYLSSVLFLALLFISLFVYFVGIPQLFQNGVRQHVATPWDFALNLVGVPILRVIVIILGIVMLIPAFTMATSFTNWLITHLIPPRVLPKMEFEDYIPREFSTIAVIPGMIASNEDVDSLVFQIEKHYLRNPEAGFQFAILTDFTDADKQTRTQDAKLLSYGQAQITKLNKKYAHLPITNETNLIKIKKQSIERFFFLHRKRLWNPSEQKWMGWERKRGKLHEFNKLIRGNQEHSFISLTDELQQNPLALNHVKYVITLDDDTILPIGAGKRLVGTMAHPLNQPVFSKDNTIISGYTILQPRMEIHPKSTSKSWFTRLYTGDTGLDIYTLAASDPYMDLIGEGIYVGKGIYDLDAFEKSINDYIPENTILSHDLLEGTMGRAGLVTDITMIESYPPNYMVKMLRQHRWIRGDWQLLPWLLRSKNKSHGFNCIDNWKVFDNLRRSLVAPALVFIFILGLIIAPCLALQWTLILIFTLGIPLLTSITQTAMQIIEGEETSLAVRPLKRTFLLWLVSISFLIYETHIITNAIFTTLYRLLISRKNLLQWTPAAQTARLFNKKENVIWKKMLGSLAPALLLGIGLPIGFYVITGSILYALFFASPVLLLWLIAPFIAYLINRPIIERTTEPLTQEETALLRQVARSTWGFFERFVGPDDNWLPPDHFQETPEAKIAHRTSPTNIGLLLTSILGAYDLGYLGHLGVTTRLKMTIESMTKMERYRGHFFNWYNTLNLEALPPHYVSTVDSGNLAACLVVVSQACKKNPSETVLRWDLFHGYLDLVSNLAELLTTIGNTEKKEDIKKIAKRLSHITSEIHEVKFKPEQWYSTFTYIEETLYPEITEQLLRMIQNTETVFDQKKLSELKLLALQVQQHQQLIKNSIQELIPWMPLFGKIPLQLQKPTLKPMLQKLLEQLPNDFALNDYKSITEQALVSMYALQKEYQMQKQTGHTDDVVNPEEWLIALEKAVLNSQKSAERILNDYKNIAITVDTLFNEMDFSFLYNQQKRVFHIGFNRDTGLLDNNFYDLLASEARIASVIAIAKREVPQSHWIYLARPVTRVENINTLISWSGTMFEYLLPPLFLRSYSGTLLAESAKGAVKQQIAYATSKGIPWGISESGFYRFDAANNYQYHAFGVPGLGLKRGLSKDLVISPYASLIAIGIEPQAVIKNLHSLIDYNMLGFYGMYEALDFTHKRLLLNQKHAIVAEYMAHHQGMLFMAFANYLHKDIMVERMHSDPRIQSIELLLQEQVPAVSAIEEMDKEDNQLLYSQNKAFTGISPWNVPVGTPIPQVHLLSNGSFRVLISNMGAGYISWKDKDITRWQPDTVLDDWGNWIYIQELNDSNQDQNRIWSAASQPLPEITEEPEVHFHSHMAVYRRVVNELVSVMEVTISPDDPVEIRRINLQNDSKRQRSLRITSYGEVSLSTHAADSQHPAFNKLFIESEYCRELGLQIFSRRPRASNETPLLMGHMLISNNNE
ncbi:MAG TPA: glucoamylase family protein, partial [Treponemataceae bacterium]|nr:glucoamylase family protein [Treponemataceae bacterium]